MLTDHPELRCFNVLSGRKSMFGNVQQGASTFLRCEEDVGRTPCLTRKHRRLDSPTAKSILFVCFIREAYVEPVSSLVHVMSDHH